MVINQTSDIKEIKGISEKRATLYHRLGIYTINDLVSYYPRDYIDYTAPKKISETEIGENAVICARVEKKLKPYIGKVSLYKLVLCDGETEILCNIWGSEYVFQSLLIGKEYLFHAKIGGTVLLKEISSPAFIPIDSDIKIVSKYRLTKGLTNGIISANIKEALSHYNRPESLSDEIMARFDLISANDALREIHFPKTSESAEKAARRLIFEELLLLRLGLSSLKRVNKTLTGAIMRDFDISEFYASLPFSPTDAQKRSIEECIFDMKKTVPMSRLLQGDVGSGKTLVAAAAAYFAVKNGYQAAVMAPTEILAAQHYDTLSKILSNFSLKVVLLSQGLKASIKKDALEDIKSGAANVVVGTQALIQNKVAFSNLGFVVTDEQHRFGVKQRGTLAQKGQNPHTLVMSATPIPRTLALFIYGDLDLSVLDEMPKGRIPIKTYGVDGSFRQRLYNFIIKHVNLGKQAYIVCPMIEEGVSEKASAVKYYENLKTGYLKDITLGLLHGKMKEAEKTAVMSDFKKNKISVLISTTVIEVGVDVPNAVIMLIENAEQFGLSQLHQLRGRVGRGSEESYCVLLSESQTSYAKERIDAMVKTTDGFKIAGMDLKMRGPGDFFGSKQHGLPNLKIADMSKDAAILAQSGRLGTEILEEDPELNLEKHLILKSMVKELFAEAIENGPLQ